jgi:hypothetical protein
VILTLKVYGLNGRLAGLASMCLPTRIWDARIKVPDEVELVREARYQFHHGEVDIQRAFDVDSAEGPAALMWQRPHRRNLYQDWDLAVLMRISDELADVESAE